MVDGRKCVIKFVVGFAVLHLHGPTVISTFTSSGLSRAAPCTYHGAASPRSFITQIKCDYPRPESLSYHILLFHLLHHYMILH
jgi:hypothetical protein